MVTSLLLWYIVEVITEYEAINNNKRANRTKTIRSDLFWKSGWRWWAWVLSNVSLIHTHTKTDLWKKQLRLVLFNVLSRLKRFNRFSGRIKLHIIMPVECWIRTTHMTKRHRYLFKHFWFGEYRNVLRWNEKKKIRV